VVGEGQKEGPGEDEGAMEWKRSDADGGGSDADEELDAEEDGEVPG